MSTSRQPTQAKPEKEDSGEGLREVLLRLTRPRYTALQDQIEAVQGQVTALQALEETLASLETRLTDRDDTLDTRAEEIHQLLLSAQTELAQLSTGLSEQDKALREALRLQMDQLQAGLSVLQEEVGDPERVIQRISPVLISATDEQVRENEAAYAAAVAPVIGPAIRQQIRTARQDIIDAIYPIIGQIVGKAIAEELRELTRKIDGQLRRQLDLRSRLRLLTGRLSGVPEAEQLLRGALPYAVQHVFLIHRETGLLLRHLAISKEETEDADLISGMLTAIQDFMRDSFGDAESDLEEITHGDQRILLEGGQYAYVAVVLEGVEPPGYGGLLRHTVSEINVQHENSLAAFSGDMAPLPDFQVPLGALAAPTADQLFQGAQGEPLGRGQKWALAGGLAGFMLMVGLLIFGCIFTIRLWPLAFPGAVPTATPTPLVLATATLPAASPTILPTSTPTETPAPTNTAAIENTVTPSPEPTTTFTPSPSSTAAPWTGTLIGNLNVRFEPSTGSRILGTILAGEEVRIHETQEAWYLVSWPVEGQPELEGWIWGQFLKEQ